MLGAVVAVGQPLPAGALQQGDRAIIPGADGQALCLKRVAQAAVGMLDTSDLRVLQVAFDAQVFRKREFSEAVSKMVQHNMPGGGLHLDGPASGLAVWQSVVSQGLTPVMDHERWVRSSDLAGLGQG